MKILEPNNSERYYNQWIKKGRHLDISKESRNIVIEYLKDMEDGNYVNNSKGSRSYNRLVSLKSRMNIISQHFEEYYKIEDITKIKNKDVTKLFNDMRNGKIKNSLGKPYKDIDTYAKIFKAFWHWYMRSRRIEKGLDIEDVTIDVSQNGNSKPKWVYLDDKEFSLFTSDMKFEYKVMCWFMYDSGIRAPKELINIRVNDLIYDSKNEIFNLNIRDEVSKTFGRKIKLMLCTKLLIDYIDRNKLSGIDPLFSNSSKRINEYLKRVAIRKFGDKLSEAGEYYKNITMYDIRHCSSCYWLPRYKSESALKYRFGWKKSDKIHYYSEFLGMKDTISQEDLLVDITTTELEKKLLEEKKRSQIMEDRMKVQEDQMSELRNMIIESKVNKIKKSKKK